MFLINQASGDRCLFLHAVLYIFKLYVIFYCEWKRLSDAALCRHY